MNKTAIALLAYLGCLGAASGAIDLVTPSQISHVTVFSDRAQITRQFNQQLPAGDSTLIIQDLPTGLLSDSIRVRGEGDKTITILSMENKRVFNEKLSNENEQALANELQKLQDDRRLASDQIQSLNEQLNFIKHLSQASLVTNISTKHTTLPLEQWQQGWETIGKGANNTYRAIHQQDTIIRTLDEKIDKTQRQLNQIRSDRKASQQIKLRLHTQQAGNAQFELSYQIIGSSWAPQYDLYVDTQTQKMMLRQQATVQQRTTEAWHDIQLTLSTTPAHSDTNPPNLAPWFIDFENPHVRHEMLSQRKASRALEKSSLRGLAFSEADRVSATPQMATVHDTGFSAEYQLDAKVSLASDNQAHSFTIAEYPLVGQLEIRAVPKLQPSAYLFATIQYSGDAPLPQGKLNLFRDNAYVGSSTMKTTQSGDELQLGLGEDPRIKISYQSLGDMRANQGLFKDKRRVEKHININIENLHQQTLPILILDQLPVAEDERISVKLLEASTPVNHQDETAPPGTIAWRHIYQANEKRQLNFSYSVTYPKDMTLPGFR